MPHTGYVLAQRSDRPTHSSMAVAVLGTGSECARRNVGSPRFNRPVQGDKAAHNFLSEAVVRSLPKALSATERERVLASTPLSPTLNLLSSMPLVSPCARRESGADRDGIMQRVTPALLMLLPSAPTCQALRTR